MAVIGKLPPRETIDLTPDDSLGYWEGRVEWIC